MTILHLALAADWEAAVRAGEYRVSTLGRTLEQEGFIHASADRAQLDGVARNFYAAVAAPLVVLTIDEALLDGEVRLEVPPGAQEAFPHIYGPVPVHAVTSVQPFSL
ncbi:DUF952 domain-containing protein [Sphaerisporangium sp. NPDC005289]|uniref:DUF952 domain-containing protein n=1 Tax=Sphaerisporangium sp. NPDC005289 TaxID=3155247 RepID=UPI0033A3730A